MAKLAPRSATRLPLAVSLLSAGNALEICDDYGLVDLNAMVTSNRSGFLLFTVTGDSMLDDIKPGYLVFVDSEAEPRTGSVIAAHINGSVCIKVFQHRQSGLYLVPRNPAYKPRKITETDDFHVLGVVRGHLALY